MARNVQVVRVPQSVAVPVNEIPAAEWLDVSTKIEALSHNTFDPVAYGAVRSDPGAASANVTAIQAAADNAASAGGTLVIKGTFWIDATVTFRCHVDGSSGTLRTSNNSIAPAVRVGSRTVGERLHNAHIILPMIRQEGKGGPGWSGFDTGLEIVNTYSSHITVTDVGYFSTGVRLTAFGTGCVYNNINVGMLETNKVNMQLVPGDAAGWVNENVFTGGRYQMNSDEGVNIPGARHILISNGANKVNNNIWIKPSIEGNGPQYHIETFGAENTFIQGRYEAAPPRIHLASGSTGHVFAYGFNLHQAVFTRAADGGFNTTVHSRQQMRLNAGNGAGGTLAIANGSSATAPAILVQDYASFADSDPTETWVMRATSRAIEGRRVGDTDPRVTVDYYNGRVLASSGLGTGGYTAGAPSGTPKGSIPIYDNAGNLLGRLPVY